MKNCIQWEGNFWLIIKIPTVPIGSISTSVVFLYNKILVYMYYLVAGMDNGHVIYINVFALVFLHQRQTYDRKHW